MEYAAFGGMLGCFVFGYIMGRCRPPYEEDLIDLHEEQLEVQRAHDQEELDAQRDLDRQSLEMTILQRMHEQLHRVVLWGQTFHESFRIYAYEGDAILCLICLDALTSTQSIIECKACDQCVGHALCVIRWLQQHPSCPTCRRTMAS